MPSYIEVMIRSLPSMPVQGGGNRKLSKLRRKTMRKQKTKKHTKTRSKNK